MHGVCVRPSKALLCHNKNIGTTKKHGSGNCSKSKSARAPGSRRGASRRAPARRRRCPTPAACCLLCHWWLVIIGGGGGGVLVDWVGLVIGFWVGCDGGECGCLVLVLLSWSLLSRGAAWCRVFLRQPAHISIPSHPPPPSATPASSSAAQRRARAAPDLVREARAEAELEVVDADAVKD